MAGSPETRTVYDFPVAAHLCKDGTVRYVKLVRRHGGSGIEGTCSRCGIAFQYRKPKPSNVRQEEGGVTHF
jgi:hypothetical protein